MKERNILGLSEKPLPKTKDAIIKWLSQHTRHNGSYALNIRIRALREKTEEEETALWHALNNENPFVWERFLDERDAFTEKHPDWTVCIEGRSNGWAVLRRYAHPGWCVDEDGLEDCTAEALRARTKLVRDFGRTVNRMCLAFLDTALDDYRETAAREKAMDGLCLARCEFIPLSEFNLEPQTLGDLSEDAPFSWGDNNRTLVTANRLRRHCMDLLDRIRGMGGEDPGREACLEAFVKRLEPLGEMYIDLEN